MACTCKMTHPALAQKTYHPIVHCNHCVARGRGVSEGKRSNVALCIYFPTVLIPPPLIDGLCSRLSLWRNETNLACKHVRNWLSLQLVPVMDSTLNCLSESEPARISSLFLLRKFTTLQILQI
ncbi:hypothetical protein AMECASPLE_021670 [Ameca splendens]|uniref:Uncharacterized protein n=1 Tax=Ameca splendens TaxID=208324 RepID=A0ABV0ZE85_9TELE